MSGNSNKLSDKALVRLWITVVVLIAGIIIWYLYITTPEQTGATTSFWENLRLIGEYLARKLSGH